jgi:outer membrane protein OmpA-like peptidoglycan-associated protein
MEQVLVRNKFGLVILGVTLVGVSGCSSVPNAINPISWYRDATGLSKNDDLGKGENEENLAAGGNQPYPNLATVPSPPDTQLSGIDRDRLKKSLVADRTNAQYSADNLRAGNIASTVPPPAPPARNTPSAPTSAATVSAAPSPAPRTPIETASAPPPPAPSAAGNPATAAAASPAAPVAAPPPQSSGANLLGSNSQQKPPSRGSEAPPAESSLQSPAIAKLPEGESATPPPPPPTIPPPNAGRPANAAPPQQATAPANAPASPAARRAGGSNRLANINFAPGSAYLASGVRGTIADIVNTHNAEGGTIRIVGFGEASGKDAAVAGLTLALDRAQAVAVALTDAGVAAKDIAVEAAPVAAKGGTDSPHAEVYLER